jgi:hypothetical protein
MLGMANYFEGIDASIDYDEDFKPENWCTRLGRDTSTARQYGSPRTHLPAPETLCRAGPVLTHHTADQ